MSTIALVVAVSKNGVIGRAGGLPWHISSDLKRFKALTLGKPVIMGRKTWESLPRKPLPGRENIVITRQSDYLAEGAHVISDVKAGIALARTMTSNEIAVIGGGEIYRQSLPFADRVYLTEVDLTVVGDTYFPKLDPDLWVEMAIETYAQGENDSAGFSLRTFARKTGL